MHRVSRCTNHNLAKIPPYVIGIKGRCSSDVDAGKTNLVSGSYVYVEAIIITALHFDPHMRLLIDSWLHVKGVTGDPIKVEFEY